MGRDIWNDRAKYTEFTGDASEFIAVIPVGAYLGAALDAAWETVNSPGHCPCGGP